MQSCLEEVLFILHEEREGTRKKRVSCTEKFNWRITDRGELKARNVWGRSTDRQQQEQTDYRWMMLLWKTEGHKEENREKENLWADNSFFLQTGNMLCSKKLFCLRQAKQAARVKLSLYICQSCGLSLPHHELIVASFGRVWSVRCLEACDAP